MNSHLPDPRLDLIYRLEASVGDPQDVGEISAGHRRIVPLTGGTFSGPELRGTLLPGASADWQIILPDGTALGDVRYTLETERGDLLYVQSQSVRHGSTAVLERLGRGEDVDASEYTFRTAVKIETGADSLDWLNKGIFIIVTGASQGIGAGLVEGSRSAGYAVVGSSRSIDPSDAPDFITVRGDIADVETAQMIVEQAVNRFGRVDSLINNAGIFISKPFTDYTLEISTLQLMIGKKVASQSRCKLVMGAGSWW